MANCLVPQSASTREPLPVTRWKKLAFHRRSKLALLELQPTSSAGCLRHQVRAHCAYGKCRMRYQFVESLLRVDKLKVLFVRQRNTLQCSKLFFDVCIFRVEVPYHRRSRV